MSEQGKLWWRLKDDLKDPGSPSVPFGDLGNASVPSGDLASISVPSGDLASTSALDSRKRTAHQAGLTSGKAPRRSPRTSKDKPIDYAKDLKFSQESL